MMVSTAWRESVGGEVDTKLKCETSFWNINQLVIEV
jgi:hypothetical protein